MKDLNLVLGFEVRSFECQVLLAGPLLEGILDLKRRLMWVTAGHLFAGSLQNCHLTLV